MALTDKLTSIADAIRTKTGGTDKFTLTDMAQTIGKLLTVSDELVTFNQMTDTLSNYLTAAKASYTDDNYSSLTVVTNYASKDTNYDDPNTYDIAISDDGTIFFCDETDERYSYSEDVAAGTYKICNLIPEHVYRWYVVSSSGATTQNGKITCSGEIRQIYANGVDNCRDFGGFSCDGGKIKYGKILRGIFPDKTTTDGKAFIKRLVGQCRIAYEINLEDQSADTQHYNLGTDVGYGYFPLVTPGSYEELFVLSDNNADKDSFIGCVTRAMENAVLGVPTYIHCSRGIDRTGAVCFYLQAILGVSGVELDINYEMTALTGSLWGSDLTKLNRTKTAWVNLRNYFNSYDGASSIRDGVLIWSRDAGIDIDLINAYRKAMSTGTPETLTYPIPPAYTNQIPISTDTDGSIYGMKLGYMNSSGVITSSGGNRYVTGFIPIKYGDVIRMDGFVFRAAEYDGTSTGNQRIAFYDGDKNFLLLANSSNPFGVTTHFTEQVGNADGDLIQFKANGSKLSTSVAYMRICTRTTKDNPIITVNEEIV